MKYTISKDCDKGILTDRTPVLQDVKDTYEVSFLLPESNTYIATFTDKQCVQYRKAITDGKCRVPKELLRCAQYVGLVVSEIDGDQILRTWECEPLRVTALCNMRQTQWELSGGMTDTDTREKISALEMAHVQLTKKQVEISTALAAYSEETVEERTRVNGELAAVKAENKRLTEAYNQAIEVINNLSERIVALEKNYDPTIIN